MQLPVFSVIVVPEGNPTAARHTVSALGRQNYPAWEAVIVAASAFDRGDSVVDDGRVRFVPAECANGTAARNRGIDAAAGAYVLPVKAGDTPMPGLLAALAAIFESEPDVAVAYTDLLAHDGSHAPLPYPTADYDPADLVSSPPTPAAPAFRREIWTAAGGYDERLTQGAEDWDFWLRCADLGVHARRVPEPLLAALFIESVAPEADGSMHAELLQRARIVVNHPGRFRPVTLAWAKALLDDADDDRCPEEIMVRQNHLQEYLAAQERLNQLVLSCE